MATVYLHIGAPKTATSTLQAALADNYRNLLKRERVLYPAACRHGSAHHVLVCDLIEKIHGNPMPDLWYGDQPRGEAWAALRKEVGEHGNDISKVILSSELLFGQVNKLDVMLAEVRENLAEHEIKVIVYLRRQDQLYSSFYNQDVKGARQWCDSAYEFYETHQIFQRDYHDMLENWSAVFGAENLLVRPYEPAQWHGGSIVQDFCHTTGIGDLPTRGKDRNESLGATQLYIKRALNRIGYDKGENDSVLRVLVKLLPEEASRDTRYINKKLYNKYRRAWKETNARLARKYLDRDELFLDPIPPALKLEEYKIDHEKIAVFLRAFIQKFKRDKAGGLRSLFARAALLVIAQENTWALVTEAERALLLSWVD